MIVAKSTQFPELTPQLPTYAWQAILSGRWVWGCSVQPKAFTKVFTAKQMKSFRIFRSERGERGERWQRVMCGRRRARARARIYNYPCARYAAMVFTAFTLFTKGYIIDISLVLGERCTEQLNAALNTRLNTGVKP